MVSFFPGRLDIILLWAVLTCQAWVVSSAAAFETTQSSRAPMFRQLQETDALNKTTGNNATAATIGVDTCPPCPQCVENSTDPQGGPVDPLVLQILVVDSQGIIDMGTLV